MKRIFGILLSAVLLVTTYVQPVYATYHIYEEEGYCPDVMYANALFAIYEGYYCDYLHIAPGTVPVGTPIKVVGIRQSGYYQVQYPKGNLTMVAPVNGLNISVEDAMAENAEQLAILTAMDNPRFTLSFLPSTMGIEPVTKKPLKAEGIPYPNEAGLGKLQYTGLYEYLTIKYSDGSKEYKPTKAVEYVNSDTDPFALYLNDSYEQIYQRMELATYYGYNYLIILTNTANIVEYNEAIASFENNYGIKTTKVVWNGDTTMSYSRYNSSPSPIWYSVYTW